MDVQNPKLTLTRVVPALDANNFGRPFADFVRVTVTATVVTQRRWTLLTVDLHAVDAPSGPSPVETASKVLTLTTASARPLLPGTHEIEVTKDVSRFFLNEDPGGRVVDNKHVDHFGVVGELGVFQPFGDEFRARVALVSGWQPFADQRIAWTSQVSAPAEPERAVINGDPV